MKDLEKRIQINDNRVILYNISKGYSKHTYTITEGLMENGEVKKTYSLSQWDDYGLNGWTDNDENVNKVSFEFDMDHPLFLPLLHLLNYDDELTIDDDDSVENNKKYMSIYRKDNKIYMDFVDNLKDDNQINFGERFHVFIKNILPDGRSKIDRDHKDTKKRLIVFFNEAHEVLVKKCHQISIEECMLRDTSSKDYEGMKMVFRKKF